MLQGRIRGIVARSGMRGADARTIVGVSGGVDSVALLHTLIKEGVAVEVVHVNYQLRGEDSDLDEALVRAVCTENGVAFTVESVDLEAEAKKTGESIQMAARRHRYAFLSETAVLRNATHIAVGHHADDQAETVLLNMLRGAGPEGLSGMPAVRPLSGALLVRPFLDVRRKEILSYAAAQQLSWREDASNHSGKYMRNRIRSSVIPAMDQASGKDAAAAIARSAALVRAYVEDNLQPNVAAMFADAANVPDRSLSLEALERASPVWRARLILEALQRWAPDVERTQATADRVETLMRMQPGRRIQLGGITIWRDRDRLTFQGPLPVYKSVELWAGQPARIPSGEVWMALRTNVRLRLEPPDENTAFVDAGRLAFPLLVRKWRRGDRLQPLGMSGSKKVSDLLTDTKVRPSGRHGVQVVTSDGQVVWVVGVRVAAPFGITTATRKVARLRFEPRHRA